MQQTLCRLNKQINWLKTSTTTTVSGLTQSYYQQQCQQ